MCILVGPRPCVKNLRGGGGFASGKCWLFDSDKLHVLRPMRIFIQGPAESLPPELPRRSTSLDLAVLPDVQPRRLSCEQQACTRGSTLIEYSSCVLSCMHCFDQL